MPFFKVDPDRIARRADYFRKMGADQAGIAIYKDAGVTFDESAADILAQAYFMLSESYRAYRSEPTHRTNMTKIAAITCAVITTLDPMRVENPDPHNTVVRYVNPIFAMRCGMTIVQHPFHHRSFDELRRIYDKMLVTKFPCLDHFIKDVQAGTVHEPEHYNKASDKFTIGLSQKEMSELETYVSMFTVFQQLKIYKTS